MRYGKSWVAMVVATPLLTLSSVGNVTALADEPPPMQTVDSVDITRYVGLWYEIAKIPNRFQKSCATGTTAKYELTDEGEIKVTNRCYDDEGELESAEGVAKIVNTQTNAELKVSFVSFLGWRPFWGEYWVIGLDPNYKWAIVGEPERRFGWILSRTPKMDPDRLAKIFDILVKNGYQPSDFEMGLQ